MRYLKLTLILLVVGVGGWYLYNKNLPPVAPTEEPITVPERENMAMYPLSERERTLVSPQLEATFGQSEPITYTDRSGQLRVSFQGQVMEQTRNPGALVYLNGVRVGEVEGRGIISAGFSPDGRYFSFKTFSVCGAVCRRQDISIIDLQEHSVVTIANPPEEGDDDLGVESNLVIESYGWGAGGALSVTTFLTIDSDAGDVVRTSHKHLWRYDLLSGQYTLVQTLPEV